MKICHNAVVYTCEGFTDAFAVEGGRFTAIGDDARKLEGQRVWESDLSR